MNPSRRSPSRSGAGRQPASAAPVRARILHTAEDHFLTHGFSRITMDDLAAHLGMSKKTLYQHFPGKQALLDAVLEDRLARIGAELRTLTDEENLEHTARLGAVLQALSRHLAEVKEPFLYDIKRFAPESFRKITEFRQQAIPRYCGQLLREGKRQGMIRNDLDDRLVIELLLGAIQTIIQPDVLTRLGLSARTVFGTILSMVMEGLLTPPGRSSFKRLKNPFLPSPRP
jgi:AcrR family transcriptional regulator